MTMVANEEKMEIGFKSTNNGSKKFLLAIIAGALLVVSLGIGAFIFFTQSKVEVWKVDKYTIAFQKDAFKVSIIPDIGPLPNIEEIKPSNLEAILNIIGLDGTNIKFPVSFQDKDHKCDEPGFSAKHPDNSNIGEVYRGEADYKSNWNIQVVIVPLNDKNGYFYFLKVSYTYIGATSSSVLASFGFTECDPNKAVDAALNYLYNSMLHVPVSNNKPVIFTPTQFLVLEVFNKLKNSYVQNGGKSNLVLDKTIFTKKLDGVIEEDLIVRTVF